MMASFETCWISLQRRAKTFFQQLRRRKHKRCHSHFDLLTSSFPSMEVSGQFKHVFRVIDSNGDGKISSLELTEVLRCLGCEQSTASADAEGMVREIDSNGDGFIDLDEFMLAVNTDGEISGSTEEQDCLMDAFLIFDADKNGLISAKELRQVLTSLGFQNCSLQECKSMIKGVDKDGDGFVDFEEFRAMMKGRACS